MSADEEGVLSSVSVVRGNVASSRLDEHSRYRPRSVNEVRFGEIGERPSRWICDEVRTMRKGEDGQSEHECWLSSPSAELAVCRRGIVSLTRSTGRQASPLRQTSSHDLELVVCSDDELLYAPGASAS